MTNMDHNNFINTLDKLVQELEDVKSARKQVDDATTASKNVIKCIEDVQTSWNMLKSKWDKDWEKQLLTLSTNFQHSTSKLKDDQNALGSIIIENTEKSREITEQLQGFSDSIEVADQALSNSVESYSNRVEELSQRQHESLVKLEQAIVDKLMDMRNHTDKYLENVLESLSDLLNVLVSAEKSQTKRHDDILNKFDLVKTDVENSYKELQLNFNSEFGHLKGQNTHIEEQIQISKKKIFSAEKLKADRHEDILSKFDLVSADYKDSSKELQLIFENEFGHVKDQNAHLEKQVRKGQKKIFNAIMVLLLMLLINLLIMLFFDS